MTAFTQQDVEQVLRSWRDPHTDKDLFLAGAVRRVGCNDDRIVVEIVLPYPAESVIARFREELTSLLQARFPAAAVQIELRGEVSAHPARASLPALQEVKNIIAVASGKGGVGKSTTSVNLALALQAEGATVGVLDADIYGPSQPLMLGVPDGQRPGQSRPNQFDPVLAHGLQSMSIGYLVTEATPMVWRGPMATGALQQLLNQTAWQGLDYLIIDMPPGTGDIQLTLAQKVPVSGAVIVTTPQDIALLDARKGIEMFRKVEVPVLGVVENMAVHICSNCGHAEHLFGEGGGTALARDYGVELLGSLPLSRAIREQVDGGLPSVAADPESEVALRYRDIARRAAAQLALRAQQQGVAFPNIVISND